IIQQHSQIFERSQIPTPEQRYNAIVTVVNDCDYNNRLNRLCSLIDFHIQEQEMLSGTIRTLPTPKQIRGSQIPLVNGRLQDAQDLPLWTAAFFTPNPSQIPNVVQDFYIALNNKFDRLDIYSQRRNNQQMELVGIQEENIDRFFRQQQKLKCKLVLCVMDTPADSDLKTIIKQYGTIKHDIITQCCLYSKIISQSRQRTPFSQYSENIAREINSKLDGENVRIDLDQIMKEKGKSHYMFFGADVIHSTNCTEQHPSIAVVVGSTDQWCSHVEESIYAQWPEFDKCSIETIVNLEEITIERLKAYQQANDGQLPNKIVFYRVDDGQFSKVYSKEIPQIRQAFQGSSLALSKNYSADNRLPRYEDHMVYGKQKFPLLTLIIVKKRHHTRFLMYNGRDTYNVPIGTVVDTTIVDPYLYTFYLNSHKAIQGVNNLSLYTVLLDEIKLTIDELQLLTLQLCFTDQRSSNVEGVPSVIHYADQRALKAKDQFCFNQKRHDYHDDNEISNGINGSTMRKKNSSDNNIRTKKLNLSAKVH
ncbi:unnamed protein product, partial [Didymodactylos carnosus]